MRNYRRHLGPRFSEGTRLLWAAIDREKLSIADAAKRLSWLRSTLANVLYGDRRPGVGLLSDVKCEFGVELDSWALPPTAEFVPPAARAAELAEGEEPSEGAA